MIARLKKLFSKPAARSTFPPPPIDVARLAADHPIRCLIRSIHTGDIAGIRAGLELGLNLNEPLTRSRRHSDGEDTTGLPSTIMSSYLAEAVWEGQELAAEYLLSRGASPHPVPFPASYFPYQHELAPLAIAVRSNHDTGARMVRLLVSAGARERDQRTCFIQSGTPLLHLVLEYPDIPMEMLQALLESDLDPSESYRRQGMKNGETPLEIAVRRKHLGAIKLLLEAGADPNVRTSWGSTPLIDAMAYFQTECRPVLLLLEGGADPNLPGAEGKTPLQIAEEERQQDLERLLVKWGAVYRRTTEPEPSAPSSSS